MTLFNYQGLYKGEPPIETISLFPSPYYWKKKNISKLQIVDFALDCLKISFKSKISLQITDFPSNRSTRDVIMGRKQLFSITRAYSSKSHLEKWCIFSHHLVIEKTYIMFTLAIINKIIGNVYIRFKNTDDWHDTLQIADFALNCIKNMPQIENFRGLWLEPLLILS